jgi:hypothetical protein
LSLPLLLATAGLRGVLEALNKFGLLSGVKCVTGTAVLVVPLMVLPFTMNLAMVVSAAVAVRLVGIVLHATACTWALRAAGVLISPSRGLLVFCPWLLAVATVMTARVHVPSLVLYQLLPRAHASGPPTGTIATIVNFSPR